MIEKLRARLGALKAEMFDRQRELERAEAMMAAARQALVASGGAVAELEALVGEWEAASAAGCQAAPQGSAG